MKDIMTVALLCAALAAPAVAQTPAPAPEAAPAAAPAAAHDDDGDDDETPAAAPAAQAASAVQHHDFGPAGIMAKSNREDLAPLTLAVGKPVAEGEYTLKSGGYYRINIVADGSGEMGLSGGDFFRAIWINEMVVNSIEIRPLGVHSVEFDKAGELTMSFVAITPGRYVLSVPGARGESQQAVFNIQ